MRVLVAPDKFKGSLSAEEVVEAIVAGVMRAAETEAGGKVGITVDRCPIADGGEGFVDALATRTDRVEGVRDPLGREVTARCGWIGETGTAVIEMCDASGYHRLTAEERDPWEASTYGTGQLIRYAVDRGAKRVLLGLGGSATNDAGAGMAAALGWQFLTSDGETVDPKPSNFLAMERIEAPEGDPLPCIIAACDVRNPLLGAQGASHVYARQKGADDRMISFLEMALTHLAELVAEQIGVDHRATPGAGAAGGLGYGLMTFCGAEVRRGFEIVAEAVGLEARIAAADLVITGEGRLDGQSLYGKAPVEIARLARKHGKRVAIVCGQVDAEADEAKAEFDLVAPLTALERSLIARLKNAPDLVSRASKVITQWALRR